MSILLDRIVDVEQGSPEWLAARAGKVTASRIPDVLAKLKGNGEAAARRDYRVQIATEILTGQPAEAGFVSADMRWGTEQEPFAREAYEAQTGLRVDTVGFVLHPTITRAGASPDGLVGWDGMGAPAGIVQFKCPKSATHLGYIIAGVVPTDYQPQMLWEMAVTGAPWCDFVSFDPRMPEHLRLFIRRFHLDPVELTRITREVNLFLGEVDELLAKLATARPFDLPTNPTPDTPGQIIAPAPAPERRATAGGDHAGAGEDPVPL